LERASIALDQSSKAGGSIAVFDEAKYKNPIANLSLMSEMLRSIERGDITNFYQPKYDLRSGRLIGVEALVRWRHPERGMIPPDMFISMAEDTGRIRELTIDVLSRAVRDQARLAERGHLLSFAVNLSGRLLHDDEITETILDIVSPAVGKVVLEVTETSMMENPKTALGILHQFRDAGLELSIDDYGSGLSSLAYLKNIPAHELKIDKAFVMHMDESRQDALLVRSTVALAHSLGLRVTAEGVESAATLALLRSMNCDCAQGYHMSRPIPFDDLAALLDKGADIAIVDFRQHTGATGDDLGGANPTGKLPTPLPWAS
jgi:EAL domain-containing protein (putative c-di-GMP-specific phosphodiesterase class I)